MVKWYWNDVQKMAFRDRSNVEKDSPFVRVFCSVFFVRIRFAWMELFCCFISFQILPGDAFLKILGRWNLPKLGKIEIQFDELGMKPPPNVLVEILPQWAPTNLAFDGWNPPFPTYPFLRCQPFVQFFGGYKICLTRKLTWQWKMDRLKMCFLLKLVIFQCHFSFQGGDPSNLPKTMGLSKDTSFFPASRPFFRC